MTPKLRAWCQDILVRHNVWSLDLELDLLRHFDTLIKSREAINSEAPSPPKSLVCEWSEVDPDCDQWSTGCGQDYILLGGTPKSNEMNFCCFCGGTIHEPTEPKEDLDSTQE